MNINHALQEKIADYCDQLFKDQDFISKSFIHINKVKKEFGAGYALVNLGEFQPDSGEFIFPRDGNGIETMWLNHENTQEYVSSDIASFILSKIDFDNCPSDHEIFAVMAFFDQGKSIAKGRYIILSQFSYIKDPSLVKPSAITEKRIEKQLRRMYSSGSPMLVLDTSKPDFMGENLAKWLRVIKRMADSSGKPFNVMIDSSTEFPAEIPPDLKDSCLSLQFKN
jgi:hypothetical protein